MRSCFGMTEPAVASSDATNIEASIVRDGNHYVIHGRKWWTSGAGDPRCKIAIFMGKTDPSAPPHKQQSMILVPMDTPGVKIERMLTVFGYDHAPHGHGQVTFENVRVPLSNILLGEGRGFEIAQDVTVRVLDRAIQAHGGAGVAQDTFLAAAWANVRTLRLADGPDEVHIESIAKHELGKWAKAQRQSASK